MMPTSTENQGINYGAILVISIAVGVDIFFSVLMAHWSYSWFPVQASSAAPYVDSLFSLETGIGTFIFLGCTGVMAWVILFNRAPKYDEVNGDPIEGNIKLEIVWTVIPLLLVLAIAAYSIKVNNTLSTLGPKQKYRVGDNPAALVSMDPKSTVGPIEVIARQWSWEFVYPDGVRSSELHLPVDQRVNFRLISEDVLHSFYVPAFRLKQDIVPGSVISYSLTPTREGRYRLRDAMFSGAYFSQNQTDVIVESEKSFADWLDLSAKQPLQPGLDPSQPLYQRRLAKGDKGWATVPPSPPPLVNDPGNPSAPHEA